MESIGEVLFTVVKAAAILYLTPSKGPVQGGTAVLVHLSEALSSTSGVKCIFGAWAAEASVEGDKVCCVTPASGTEARAPVSVMTGDAGRRIQSALTSV